MSQQKTNRGFTIVELLIVIVVIAILAAISIIAFNGIQDRARNTTAQETAAQLRQKVESYNAVEGKYPAPTGATAANLITVLDTVDESKIDDALKARMSDTSTVTVDKPAHYAPCTPVTAGGTVTYWTKENGVESTDTYVLGNC